MIMMMIMIIAPIIIIIIIMDCGGIARCSSARGVFDQHPNKI